MSGPRDEQWDLMLSALKPVEAGTSNYFTGQRADPLSEKRSLSFGGPERAAYTPRTGVVKQGNTAPYTESYPKTAEFAGGAVFFDYAKTHEAMKKAYEETQKYLSAHHCQVQMEKETVKQLQHEIREKDAEFEVLIRKKDNELEEVKKSLDIAEQRADELERENKVLQEKEKTFGAMSEKLRSQSNKLLKYQTAHKAFLQAIQDAEHQETKEALQEYLDSFGFPDLEEEPPAESKSRFLRRRGGEAKKDGA